MLFLVLDGSYEIDWPACLLMQCSLPHSPFLGILLIPFKDFAHVGCAYVVPSRRSHPAVCFAVHCLFTEALHPRNPESWHLAFV